MSEPNQLTARKLQEAQAALDETVYRLACAHVACQKDTATAAAILPIWQSLKDSQRQLGRITPVPNPDNEIF